MAVHLITAHFLLSKKLSNNQQTIKTRLQKLHRRKSTIKTGKLLHKKKTKQKQKKPLSRYRPFSVIQRQKKQKNNLVFGLGGQTSLASVTIKSQIKVTELESSRYRGLLGVRVTYS